MMFICQLPKKEKLEYYKRIKKALLENEVFSYENLVEAMNSKVKDLDGLLTA